MEALALKLRNYSYKREVILNKALSAKCHPTADWIYDALKQEYPDLSLATVYRNLKLFKTEGRIASFTGISAQERFDGNIEPHGHFICSKCSIIIDISLFEYQKNQFICPKELEGSQIERFDISLYGICKTCLL